MKKIFVFLIFIFQNFLVHFVQAAPQAQNTSGAVSTATGGAGVAVIDYVDGALLNPSVIPFFPTKQVNLSYSTSRFAGALIDHGKDALFPAGIGYEQQKNDVFKNTIYHLILAYPVGQRFSIGANFHYNQLRFLTSDTVYTQTLVNLGLIWQATKAWTVGLVHKDLALSDTDLADSIDHVATTTLGAAYVYETFAQLRFDIESVEKQPSGRYIYKMGLETYVNDWIITRFGYRNDNIASMNFGSAGVGFAGPQFGLHYAYQWEANNTVDPLHVIDLSFPF